MIFIASILLLYYGRDWLDIKFVSRESRVVMRPNLFWYTQNILYNEKYKIIFAHKL